MFARFQTPEEHEALVNGLLLAKKLRGQIELYHHYRAMGIRSIEEAKEYELERKRREDEIKVEKHRKEAPHLFPASSHNSNKSSGASRRGRGGGDASNGEESEGGGGQVKRQRGDEDDLAAAFEELKAAPGASLLSHNELALCAELPMLPMHYLAVKEAIVREACRNGHLNEESIHRVIKVRGYSMSISYSNTLIIILLIRYRQQKEGRLWTSL